MTHTLLFNMLFHTTGSEKNSGLEINFILLHYTIHEDQHKICHSSYTFQCLGENIVTKG